VLTEPTILTEIARQGIQLKPGKLGENNVIDGIIGKIWAIGIYIGIGKTLSGVTEVRNPCTQLNEMRPHLNKHLRLKRLGKFASMPA